MADIDDILASVSAINHDSRKLDLQALTRAWVNERGAPELLPYPTTLMDRTTDRIRSQIETIETMASAMDPSANFKLVVLQTELERYKFLVRSFLRARIAKIDKFSQHYLTAPAFELLSSLEQQYLQNHASILSSHYSAAFLASFPTSLQKLDDTSGGVSMVDTPDIDSAVFVRVLRDCGTAEVYGDHETSEVDLKKRDVWVLRWRTVGEHVKSGDVELI
ncbi:hypothetical protein AMS68_004353 [Peltaster fructicola]|uniref:DNA replication complex GINS protein SLD5 n=1 Tax=Peltaster fructicola TaxID=286661 RepID=A0A6H0XVX4_9PEZI|nr:hypothetical protein AMS68_004353 [Peltaster fructicola]